jgi:hypothetical protein
VQQPASGFAKAWLDANIKLGRDSKGMLAVATAAVAFRAQNAAEVGSVQVPGRTVVAVHIRTLNPHDRVNCEHYVLPRSHYHGAIATVRAHIAAAKRPPPLFRIYSQAFQGADFSEFAAADVEVCLDSPLRETFCGLVLSDYLITSKSSLSFSAALLCASTTEVFYTPFWHSAAPHWHVLA